LKRVDDARFKVFLTEAEEYNNGTFLGWLNEFGVNDT
jgi:hypothetical protein